MKKWLVLLVVSKIPFVIMELNRRRNARRSRLARAGEVARGQAAHATEATRERLGDLGDAAQHAWVSLWEGTRDTAGSVAGTARERAASLTGSARDTAGAAGGATRDRASAATGAAADWAGVAATLLAGAPRVVAGLRGSSGEGGEDWRDYGRVFQ